MTRFTNLAIRLFLSTALALVCTPSAAWAADSFSSEVENDPSGSVDSGHVDFMAGEPEGSTSPNGPDNSVEENEIETNEDGDELLLPSSIRFSAATVTLEQGKSLLTSLIVEPEGVNSIVAYSSSNDSVAKVDASGKITAIRAGTTTITARSDNGVKAMCTVTVKLPMVSAKASANGVGKIKVSWTKASNATGYYVYRASSKSSSYKKVATVKGDSSLSYSDKGLAKGKTYYYKVKPYYSSNSSCNGAYSSVVFAKATVKTPTLSTKSSSSSSSKIKISWSKVSGADGYYVYRKRSSSSSWKKIATVKSGNTLSYTDKNASGVDYYAVVAYDKNGSKTYTSSKSNYIKARGLERTTTVAVAQDGSGYNQKVKWKSVSGATGYQVYCRIGEDGSWKRVATVGKVTSYTMPVQQGQLYTYKIRPIYKNSTGTTYGAFKQSPRGYILYDTSGTAAAFIHAAKAQPNGKPDGGNRNIYNNYNNSAWCAYFISWCARSTCVSTSAIPNIYECNALKNFYKTKGQWHNYRYIPKAGDLIFYSTYGGGVPCHVGIVISCSNGKVYTKEGNVTGGKIASRSRIAGTSYVASGWYIVGYASPKY